MVSCRSEGYKVTENFVRELQRFFFQTWWNIINNSKLIVGDYWEPWHCTLRGNWHNLHQEWHGFGVLRWPARPWPHLPYLLWVLQVHGASHSQVHWYGPRLPRTWRWTQALSRLMTNFYWTLCILLKWKYRKMILPKKLACVIVINSILLRSIQDMEVCKGSNITYIKNNIGLG